jgi:hypothetical protein
MNFGRNKNSELEVGTGQSQAWNARRFLTALGMPYLATLTPTIRSRGFPGDTG